MWRFDDIISRENSRDNAWQLESWANTIAKTSGLARKMKCEILRPMPKSPSQ